jgi:hypothetical protein
MRSVMLEREQAAGFDARFARTKQHKRHPSRSAEYFFDHKGRKGHKGSGIDHSNDAVFEVY